MLGRRVVIGMGMLAVAILSGCYASTEPATEIGPESAKLNARGTADNGPATSYFEYWITGSSRDPARAGNLHWPAGASGPFSLRIAKLSANTSYSFRVCGADDGDETGAHCANTRSFTTKPAVEDAAFGGFWAGCCSRFEVDARSGATGASPRGTLTEHISDGGLNRAEFSGSVTCLAASGSRAAVGAVGTYIDFDGSKRTQTRLWTIVDGRANRDTWRGVTTEGGTPPNCAGASFANQSNLIDPTADFIVNDAP